MMLYSNRLTNIADTNKMRNYELLGFSHIYIILRKILFSEQSLLKKNGKIEMNRWC